MTQRLAETVVEGLAVVSRSCSLIAVGLVCAGCAAEPPSLALGLAGAKPPAETSAIGAPDKGGKTMAAKVLAAIALERITGRAPDPSRFDELR